MPVLAALPGAKEWATIAGPPTIILVGPKHLESTLRSQWTALLKSERLYDYRIRLTVLDQAQKLGTDMGRVWRSRMVAAQDRDAEAVWQLVGPDLESYLEGSGLPTVDQLTSVLNVRYGPSPVEQLQAFLREHPDHWEARQDLLRLLRARVVHLLENQAPGDGQDLDSDTDERVWGPMARQLDLMFNGCDWAVASPRFHMYLGLPEGVPERRSPLMKALYRRHRPLIQAMLRRNPENYAIWNGLIRIQGALGGSLLGGVGDLPALQESDDLRIFLSVAMFLKRNLHDTSDWAEAKRIFHWIWEMNILPILEKGGARWFMDPRMPDPEARGRDAIWTYVLEPMAEAMIRTGSEREWSTVRASAGDLVPEAGMNGLLRRLNRRDLAHQFRPMSGVPKPERPFPNPGGFNRGLMLVLQGPGASERSQGLYRAFAKTGVELRVDSNPDAAMADYFRWPKGQARWALVTPDGKALLEGMTLPTMGEFLDRFKALAPPRERDRLRGVLAVRPDNLPCLAKLAKECSLQAGALLAERLELLSQGRTAQITEDETRAWEEYASCVRQLLDDPLGTSSGLLPMDGVNRWAGACRQAGTTGAAVPREALESIERLGRGLATSFLPNLEADIVRRPSDVGLWLLWLDLSFFSERDPASLLESVVPSPLANPIPMWPSEMVLTRILQDLKVAKRWPTIVDILDHRWKRAAQASASPHGVVAKASGKQPLLSAGLLMCLLEALVRMGRDSEADAILGEARGLGMTLEKGDHSGARMR